MIQSHDDTAILERDPRSKETGDVEIFASAWPQPFAESGSERSLGPSAVPRIDPGDFGETIFAQAWPEEIGGRSSGAMAYSSAREIDALWEEFDQEVSQVLGASLCPHCHSFVRLDLDRPTVTCDLCGSTFATFHASPFFGQA